MTDRVGCMTHTRDGSLRPRRGGRRLQRVALGCVLVLVAAALGGRFAASPVTAPPAAAAGDPVIAAAGDIACDPTNANFNGGLGTSGSCRQKWTSDLVYNQGYNGVLLLGDNQYYCGGYNAFLQSYDPSWGRFKSITYPAVGNHEYLTSGGTDCTVDNTGAAGHFKYFGAAAGDPSKGYYSFDIGTWHMIMLNSNCGAAGGCGASSPQGTFLRDDLASHPNYCTLAFWHVPVFSSGGRADATYKTFWDALYAADADVVLNGHDHLYERFAPQTPAGAADPQRGIREFVVGTGGANHTTFTSTIFANSEVRDDKTFGVLKLTLHPTSYDWQFVPDPGATTGFTDSGTTACHTTTTDTTPPSAPTNLAATAPAPNRVDLTWTASTDDSGTVAGYHVMRNGTQIATVTTNSYSDTSALPATTSTYTVTAFDAAANVSQPSNAATATTPSDTTPPSAPSGLTATNVSAGEVDLAWSASTDDVGVSSYKILRGGVQVGAAAGLSYADTTVQASSSYTYTVVAVDAAGNQSGASNAVTVTTPSPPTTLTFAPTADTYVESDTATTNYGAATKFFVDNSPIKHTLLKFSVNGVNGRAVTSAKLKIYCIGDASVFGGEFHKLTDLSWNESTVTYGGGEPASDPAVLGTLGAVALNTWYTVDVTPAVTGDGAVGFKIVSTSSDGASYSSKEGTAGLAPQLVVTTSSTPGDTTAPTPPTNLVATAPSPARVDLVWTASTDDSGNVAGYKVFRNGTQVATSSTAAYTDPTVQPGTSYTYAVSAYDAAGNVSASSNDAAITTPADTTPPSAPATLDADATTAGRVDLTWAASTDDVGVKEYRIFRDGTQIATSTATTYSDTTVAGSATYTYTVRAADGAGNLSAPSNAVTVTTAPTPTFATLTFTAAADAYVASDKPTTSYGARTALKVDASPDRRIYLKFTVTGVGTRTVQSAKLRLYCVDASPAGGAVHRVADTTWSESAVTWNTAPPADAATIASLGSVAMGTWYELDLSSLVTRDGTYSVQLTSPSTNGADYSSKEGSNAPQLVLTVS